MISLKMRPVFVLNSRRLSTIIFTAARGFFCFSGRVSQIPSCQSACCCYSVRRFYESRHSSEVCGSRNPLRLRQRDQDPLHQVNRHRRHLQLLPSVLYGPAEVRGYGRSRGQVPTTRRQDRRRTGRFRSHQEKRRSRFFQNTARATDSSGRGRFLFCGYVHENVADQLLPALSRAQPR